MMIVHGKTYKVQFRRRREGKTNYRYRVGLLKSGLPRAVVRKTLRNTSVQFVKFEPKGDHIIASAISSELKKEGYGWKGSTSNTTAAYLTGFLAGKRANDSGVTSAVLDIGLCVPSKGSKIFALLKGMLDAGINIPHSEEILPSMEMIKGNIDPKIFEKMKNRLEKNYDRKKKT